MHYQIDSNMFCRWQVDLDGKGYSCLGKLISGENSSAPKCPYSRADIAPINPRWRESKLKMVLKICNRLVQGDIACSIFEPTNPVIEDFEKYSLAKKK